MGLMLKKVGQSLLVEKRSELRNTKKMVKIQLDNTVVIVKIEIYMWEHLT